MAACRIVTPVVVHIKSRKKTPRGVIIGTGGSTGRACLIGKHLVAACAQFQVIVTTFGGYGTRCNSSFFIFISAPAGDGVIIFTDKVDLGAKRITARWHYPFYKTFREPGNKIPRTG